MRDQRSGARYHVRNLKPAPFVLAVLVTLLFGTMIAIVHTGPAVLFGLVGLAHVLIWLYLSGPASSVTVRGDTLEISNAVVRYAVPRDRVLSIDYVDTVGVRVRVEGGRLISVGAFSRALFRWRNPSRDELEGDARRLTDALFADPGPAVGREVETGYRWANLLAAVAGAILLGILAAVARRM